MNYVEKQYSDIFESMLEDSLEKGLISHAEDFEDYIDNKEDISNYYVMDKSVIALMVSKVYKDITNVYESAKVEYADGIDLDDIGVGLGIYRPQESKSSVIVTFSLPAVTDEEIRIPAGFVISTTDNVQYETVEEIYLPIDSTQVNVACMSLDTGIKTKVASGSLTEIVSSNQYNLSCTNRFRSSGGNSKYTDDEYRYLLLNWFKIHMPGSLEAFEYYFANLDGLDDYRIVPNWDGSGTIKIIVDPGDSELLNTIYTDLRRVVGQTDKIITLFSPVNKYIRINAKVNVDIDQINPYSENEKLDIQSKIIAAIKVFIDGGYISDGDSRVWYPGLGLGEDFIPHKLAVFLDEEIPELQNIIFDDVSNIVILDEEKGICDEINVEMM